MLTSRSLCNSLSVVTYLCESLFPLRNVFSVILIEIPLYPFAKKESISSSDLQAKVHMKVGQMFYIHLVATSSLALVIKRKVF